MSSAPLAAEEIVHIAGDPHVASTVMKAKSDAQVTLRYSGRHVDGYPQKELTCEVNVIGESIRITTMCVRCHQAQSITNERKKISFDPQRGLFIEPFECTWELPGSHKGFSGNLCRTRVAYDGRTIKDA